MCHAWLTMTKDQAISYYGAQHRLGKVLGVTQSTISVWKLIPYEYQLVLHRETKGALQADNVDDYIAALRSQRYQKVA
jgi:hypothetical protein